MVFLFEGLEFVFFVLNEFFYGLIVCLGCCEVFVFDDDEGYE